MKTPNIVVILFSAWMLICVLYVSVNHFGVTTTPTTTMTTKDRTSSQEQGSSLPPMVCPCDFKADPPASVPNCPKVDSSPKPPKLEPLPPLSISIPTDCAAKYGPSETRRVYTYHQILTGFRNDTELLQLWKLSWSLNCWEPIILDENHAMLHNDYQSLVQKLEQLPTVNPKLYELSCYIRYVAMSAVGGGIMVDNDVINLNFKPNEMTSPLPERFTCYDRGIPSMVYGTREEYDRVINYMANYQLRPNDKYNGRNHTSDMYILGKMLDEKLVDGAAESPIKLKKIKHLSASWTSKVRNLVGINVGKTHLARLLLLLS